MRSTTVGRGEERQHGLQHLLRGNLVIRQCAKLDVGTSGNGKISAAWRCDRDNRWDGPVVNTEHDECHASQLGRTRIIPRMTGFGFRQGKDIKVERMVLTTTRSCLPGTHLKRRVVSSTKLYVLHGSVFDATKIDPVDVTMPPKTSSLHVSSSGI